MQESATVTGELWYRERIALLPDVVVEVKLVDVSKQDVPATVISEQTIKSPGQVPIAFVVAYDTEGIIPNHRYCIQARILEADGKLIFITTQAYPVITLGNPTSNVSIMLQKVG